MGQEIEQKNTTIIAEYGYEENTSLGNIQTVRKITEIASNDVRDFLYISESVHMPEKKDIKHCYRKNFIFLRNEQAKEICRKTKGVFIAKEYEHTEYFVYNPDRKELVPFKKQDYLMNDSGYMTTDGKKYYYYDNNGNFKEYMVVEGNKNIYYDAKDTMVSYTTFEGKLISYYDDQGNMIGQEEQELFIEEEDAEILVKREYKKKKPLLRR